MANLTKLYLRDTTAGVFDVGIETAPGTATLDVAKADVTVTGAGTNRQLSGNIGTAQVQVDLTTLGQTAAQSGWFRRYVTAPLTAQTIGAQSVSLVGAFSESNGASDFRPTFGLYLWDPAGGTVVKTMVAVGAGLAAEPGTTQTLGTATATTAAATASAGHRLVLEVWRNSGTQVNTASRTNSIYYDGTTENSTTSNAAYLSFATAVAIPTTFTSTLTASMTSSAAIGSAYTPAPSTTYGLVAVHTHSE